MEKVICKPNDLCTHLFLQLRPSFKENVHVRALNANSLNRVARYKGHENFQHLFVFVMLLVMLLQLLQMFLLSFGMLQIQISDFDLSVLDGGFL